MYEDITRVALDVEDTLAAVNHKFIENREGVDFEDMDNYDFEGVPVTRGEFLEETHRLWKDSWYEIPPTEDDIGELVGRMYEMEGIDIDIVTARHGCDEEIKRWLEKHEVPYSDFVVSSEKHKLDYDVYIDDKPDMAGKANFLFLYPRPWNRDIAEGSGVKRIESLGDVVDSIDEF
ncbi:MAG: hypothetical protein ABEJ72_08930 [Candidatus Aenigmatarchaeota archaeon]